jgi:hypothetical protein
MQTRTADKDKILIRFFMNRGFKDTNISLIKNYLKINEVKITEIIPLNFKGLKIRGIIT